jgi:hypothetical protein
MSRFNHDGTQMGWNPIGWEEYPRAYFSPGSGTFATTDSQRHVEMRCISLGPRHNTWILDVGPYFGDDVTF